jgi:hypothetical protein
MAGVGCKQKVGGRGLLKVEEERIWRKEVEEEKMKR